MDLDYGTINETFSLRSNNLLYTEFMDLMSLDYESIKETKIDVYFRRERLYGAFARSSIW